MHEKGIVHRDLKYDNVVVSISKEDMGKIKSSSGNNLLGFDKKKAGNFDKEVLHSIKVKIIDFNVSRCKSNRYNFIFDRESKKNVIMYSIAGTPYFSAPELLECLSCYTEQVDIWSVGCLLYYMTFGGLPFKGDK
jgi:serine/threonine protein kinase